MLQLPVGYRVKEVLLLSRIDNTEIRTASLGQMSLGATLQVNDVALTTSTTDDRYEIANGGFSTDLVTYSFIGTCTRNANP